MGDGTILLVRRVPSSPLIAVRMYSLGGLTAEDEKTNGIGNLTMRMLMRGTTFRSANQLAEQLEADARRGREPFNSMAYSDLTIVLLLPLGRIGEGVHEMRIAEKTDPLSPSVQSSLAWALLSAGRYEEAAGHCQKAADTRCLGRARLGQGRIDEAVQLLATGSDGRELLYRDPADGRLWELVPVAPQIPAGPPLLRVISPLLAEKKYAISLA